MIHINRKICADALDHYGSQHQHIKLMEECAELIQAAAKEITVGHYGTQVEEELADVLILIAQIVHDYDETEIQEWIDYKLERLSASMEEDKK